MPRQEIVDAVTAIVLGLTGVFAVCRAFLAKEFYLMPLGGTRGLRLPNWLGRPLVLLVGVAALALAIALWRK